MIQDLNLCRSSVFTLLIASFLQVWIHYCFKKHFQNVQLFCFDIEIEQQTFLNHGKKNTQQKSFSMFSCWTLICFFRLQLKSTDHITVSTWLPHLPLAIQKQVDLIASNGIPLSRQHTQVVPTSPCRNKDGYRF